MIGWIVLALSLGAFWIAFTTESVVLLTVALIVGAVLLLVGFVIARPSPAQGAAANQPQPNPSAIRRQRRAANEHPHRQPATTGCALSGPCLKPKASAPATTR
jgi:hypothetical protein